MSSVKKIYFDNLETELKKVKCENTAALLYKYENKYNKFLQESKKDKEILVEMGNPVDLAKTHKDDKQDSSIFKTMKKINSCYHNKKKGFFYLLTKFLLFFVFLILKISMPFTLFYTPLIFVTKIAMKKKIIYASISFGIFIVTVIINKILKKATKKMILNRF